MPSFPCFPYVLKNKQGGEWELVLNGYKGSAGEDEKGLEMYGDDGYITV